MTAASVAGASSSSSTEPFQETLQQLARLNKNMKQKYRSIGIMDDFSGIVTNMIGSLQEVQSKGEAMVKKIKTQEEKLSNVVKDIESKEEYVKQVHFEMQQIDGINDRIKAELEKTQQEKVKAENDLKTFLLKKSQVLDKIKKQSAIIEQRKSEEQKEIKKFQTMGESKQKIIDDLKDKLEHYEYLIQDANESLSKLGPKEDTSAVAGPDSSMLGSALSRSEVVYPALLISLIVNIVTAAFILKLAGPIIGDVTGSGDVQEKWDNFAHEKPHTMYDQVLEKVAANEEFLDHGTLQGKESLNHESLDPFNDGFNEIDSKPQQPKKKIKNLKRRKSYIYQNLYKKEDRIGKRD